MKSEPQDSATYVHAFQLTRRANLESITEFLETITTQESRTKNITLRIVFTWIHISDRTKGHRFD